MGLGIEETGFAEESNDLVDHSVAGSYSEDNSMRIG